MQWVVVIFIFSCYVASSGFFPACYTIQTNARKSCKKKKKKSGGARAHTLLGQVGELLLVDLPRVDKLLHRGCTQQAVDGYIVALPDTERPAARMRNGGEEEI